MENNEIKRVSKKNIVLYLSIAVILISITFKASYAFFTPTVVGNDTVTQTKAVAGKLAVNFETSEYISNNSLFLIKDSERASKAETTRFTVSNANTGGTVPATYELYLTNLSISNGLKSADFKWELIVNGDVKGSGSFASAQSGVDFKISSSPISIAVGQTDSCVFRIWLSETEQDQSGLLGSDVDHPNVFTAKVKMQAVSGK